MDCAATNGIYIRRPAFCEKRLLVKRYAAYPCQRPFHPLFDPEQYLTVPGKLNSYWLAEFNGTITPAYCAIVERTHPRSWRYLSTTSWTVRRRSEMFNLRAVPMSNKCYRFVAE